MVAGSVPAVADLGAHRVPLLLASPALAGALVATLEVVATGCLAGKRVQGNVFGTLHTYGMATSRNNLFHLDRALHPGQIQPLVALYRRLVSAGELDVPNYDRTRTTGLSAKLPAHVLAGRPHTGTLARAEERLVQRLGVTPRPALVPARLEAFPTRQVTAAVGALEEKVAWLSAEDGRLGVAGAAERDGVAYCAGVGELRMDVGPHLDSEVRLRVADEVHAVLSAAEEDVDAVLRA